MLNDNIMKYINGIKKYKNPIIIIFIFFIFFIITYYYYTKYFYEYITLHILNQIQFGNIILMYNNEILFEKINNDTISKDKTPIIFIKNRDKFFKKVYKYNEVGLGHGYVKGYWTTNNLLDMLTIFSLNRNVIKIPNLFKLKISSFKINDDHKKIKHHYDVGNEFYQTFLLDDLSSYSCGIWKNNNDTLNDAQYRKIHTIIKKLNPIKNSDILDIGCGWGKIANYVAKVTNCKVDGITLSDEQVKYAMHNYNNNVNIYNMHYIHLQKKYDYIYSIGMFEHVRYENYDTFFKCIKRILKPNGKFLLHTIIDVQSKDKYNIDKSFISEYIFPAGQIPNNDWIMDYVVKNNLTIIHSEVFGGQHYAKTLNEWYKNLKLNKKYIVDNFGHDLFKKYEYYFNICEAGFKVGKMAIGHYLITNNMINTLDDNYI
jgi:cyclopropane-fatty-acyl-phospholipid synthase